MSEAAPTVIVVRRVHPGRESDFRRWNDRLIAAASAVPGYVGSEVQPPNDAHPEEWVNIYRFEQQDQLEQWIESGERAALMIEGTELLAGPTREQRIAQPDASSDVVTAVMSKRIRPDAADEYRYVQTEITQAMRRFPGFVQSQVFEPVPGIQEEHVTVFTFDSREHLDAWLSSDERREVLRVMEPLLEGENMLSVVGGFGGWFAADAPHVPPKWKQAVAVLIALYPTTLTLSYLQRQFAPDVPWVPALFVSNVLGIAALTWVLMPLVTKWLDPWLQRP